MIEVQHGAARPVLLAVDVMPLTFEGGVDARRLQRVMTLGGTHRPEVAVIEKVGSAPGQGVGSSFAFGRWAGMVEGVAHCSADRVVFATPAEWKAAYRLPGGRAGKVQSVQMAAKLVDARMTDGCAEALLLAWYAARHRC